MCHSARYPLLTGNISMVSMKKQSGVMLLEALIAVLIFSLGILSLVALQTVSIKLTGDARYRASASNLAERLFSEMRMSRLNVGQIGLEYKSDEASNCDENGICVCEGGGAFTQWCTAVQTELGGLVDLKNAPPTVVVDSDVNSATYGTVVATIFWRPTPDTTDISTYRKHIAVTRIRS